MKIVFLTTSFPAYKGHLQSPFVYKLAENLVKEGNSVDIVCPYYRESKKKHEVSDGINIHRFRYFFIRALQKLTSGGEIKSNLKKSFLAKVQFPLLMLSMFLFSLKYIRKCDVIHAQWLPSAFVGVFLKKLFRKPLVFTERGSEIDVCQKNKFLKRILLFVLKNCDEMTAICQDFLDTAVKLGYSKNKITRISNGVDEEFMPRNKNEMRKKLGVPTNKKIILFVGWLVERKGVQYLIEAVPAVIKKDKNVLFLIVGEGILKDELEKRIGKLNIQKYVKMVGPKNPDEIPYWMNTADIFVLPTMGDGRPNVVIEALASGLPVITTNMPGPAEVVNDKKTGYLVDINNSKQIADKLLFMLKKPSLITRLSKNARKEIVSKGWTWKTCAKNYVNVYKKAIKKA